MAVRASQICWSSHSKSKQDFLATRDHPFVCNTNRLTVLSEECSNLTFPVLCAFVHLQSFFNFITNIASSDNFLHQGMILLQSTNNLTCFVWLAWESATFKSIVIHHLANKLFCCYIMAKLVVLCETSGPAQGQLSDEVSKEVVCQSILEPFLSLICIRGRGVTKLSLLWCHTRGC